MPSIIHSSGYLLRQFFEKGLKGLKLYWLPFILIQGFGVAIVFLYYHVTRVTTFCDQIAVWKAGGGLWATAWMAGLFCGLLPELVKSLTGRGRKWNSKILVELSFLFFYFACNGLLNAFFYDFQAWVFGSGTGVKTIATKVLVDQFIFTPFIGYPFAIIFFTWRDNNFDFLSTLKSLSFKLYLDRTKSMIFIGWCYWFPMVTCTYALPTALQFPLNICATAAWSLLLVFILESGENPQPQREEA